MKTVQHKKIQRGAHAATYVSAWWTLFSLFGLFDWRDARRSIGDPNAAIPLAIWGIHLFLIGLAILAWHRERPRKALWIGEGDAPPAAIGVWRNKLRQATALKASLALWMLALACFASALWPGRPTLGATALVLSAALILNIFITKLTDAVLNAKVRAARGP